MFPSTVCTQGILPSVSGLRLMLLLIREVFNRPMLAIGCASQFTHMEKDGRMYNYEIRRNSALALATLLVVAALAACASDGQHPSSSSSYSSYAGRTQPPPWN